MKAAVFFLVLGFSALETTADVWAQDSTPLIASMSVGELRKCGQLAQNRQIEQAAFDDEDNRLYKEGIKVRVESQALEYLRSKTNPGDRAQVDLLATRSAELDASIARYNDWIARRNARAEHAQQETNAFNVQCAHRPYNKADLEQLRPGEREAMKAGSSTFSVPGLVRRHVSQPTAPSAPSSGGESSNAFTIGGDAPPRGSAVSSPSDASNDSTAQPSAAPEGSVGTAASAGNSDTDSGAVPPHTPAPPQDSPH